MRFKVAVRGLIRFTGAVLLVACSGEIGEEGEYYEEEYYEEEEELGQVRQGLTLEQRIAGCQTDPRVVAGVVSLDVCVGADLFFRETFDGNGRSCATCHRVDNNFTIDPAFIATLPSNDPLFVAEFNSTLANLERPAQMRARSLILENADGFAPDPNVRFVLRSVPHNFSMGTSVTRAAGDTVTPPDHRTGWSGDGAPNLGQLRDFQTGAIIQHYTKRLNRVAGTDFRLATSGELDRIDLFMRRLGRTNELNLANVTMSDSGAEAGRQTFLSAAARCNGCHANAGANAGFGGGGNRNFNTGVESARNTALAGFPRDGGFLGTPANADGSFGDGSFNTPPLVEAADTGPFFHTDTTVSGASAHNAATANTIEQAVAFYDSPAFNNSPSGAGGQINLDATQINNLGRFLRVINASFNAQLAIKRLDAANALVNRFGSNNVNMQRTMIRMAMAELDDAIAVLGGVSGLNGTARGTMQTARGFLFVAVSAFTSGTRQFNIVQGRNLIAIASNALGNGLTLTIGEGTVMF
jgi:mono/diheme cytochrome c family protein